MIIKICGMREAANIRAVEALHPDWMGFIFWPKSSRRVSEKPTYLPTKCKRVGVFVDENIETVKQIANDYALDIIQLHGHESPEYVAQLHEWEVVKAINIGTEKIWSKSGNTKAMPTISSSTREPPCPPLLRRVLRRVLFPPAAPVSTSTGLCSPIMSARPPSFSPVASAPTTQSASSPSITKNASASTSTHASRLPPASKTFTN